MGRTGSEGTPREATGWEATVAEPGVAVFGGVSSHRPTSIPTVCYVLFSAALIAPAAMLLLLLAEAFETAVDAVPLAEEIEDDASDGLEAALERRGGMQTVAHESSATLIAPDVDGRVPRRAWPPRRRQRRVPRRSGQHGPSPEEQRLRSRP